MRRDYRFYTLIIAPAAGSRFYRVVFHHRQLYAVTIGCLVSLTLLTITSIWVFNNAGLLINYHRIQRENRALKQKDAVLLQQLQTRLDSIKAESDRIRRVATQMGLNVDEELGSGTEGGSSGVGGPRELDSFAAELDRVASNLKVLHNNLNAEKTRLDTTPVGWPIPGRLTSGFGRRHSPFGKGYEYHPGVDIGAEYGRPVVATAEGVVIYAGYRGGYGKLVVIEHRRGLRTFYGHLSRISVSVGDRVKRGDQIGRVGRTGRATAAHVHYEIRLNDRPVNPRKFAQPR